MLHSETTNVQAAFEMLLEEVENEIEFVNEVGSRAFGERNYGRVDEARQQAVKLTAFREQIAVLRQEWNLLSGAFDTGDQPEEAVHEERRNLGRLRRDMRTSEDAYRLPILQALVQLGGVGRIGDILSRVEAEMKPQLKEVDYEPLGSNPNMRRWRNTAQWTRNALVKEGLMKDNSAHGVWEISESGWRYLARG
jgi:restriction system protein